MIAAAIDIGTNTTLALLAESTPDGLRPLKDQLTINRLGDSLKNGSVLAQHVIALNVDLLNEIVRDYRRDGAQDFVLCGTSALRRAENRYQFIGAVREILGLNVEIITGREEAAFTYVGALSNRDVLPGERVCVMDVGGGSTEIVEGRGGIPGAGFSIDVGSAMLTNEFFANDPPSGKEISALRTSLQNRLPDLVRSLRGAAVPWILVGGTSVTLAILKAGLRWYDPLAVGGSSLTSADIGRLIASFEGKSSQQLQNLPGMPSGRGRSILAGAVLLQEMFRALDLQEGIVSERGLRHGLWLARFGKREKT